MEISNAEEDYGNDSDPDVTAAGITTPAMVHVKHATNVGSLTAAPATSTGAGASGEIASTNERRGPEKKPKGRARAKNWTEEEKNTLLYLILEQMPHRSSTTWTWERVTEDLQKRSGSAHLRTVEQCKQQLRDLKKGYQAAVTKRDREEPSAPIRFKFRDPLEAIYRKEKETLSLGTDFGDGDAHLVGGTRKRRGPKMRILPTPSKRRRKSAPSGFANPIMDPIEAGVSPAPGLGRPGVGQASGTGAGVDTRVSGADGSIGAPGVDPGIDQGMAAVPHMLSNGIWDGEQLMHLRKISDSLSKIPSVLDSLSSYMQEQVKFQKQVLGHLDTQAQQTHALMNLLLNLSKDASTG